MIYIVHVLHDAISVFAPLSTAPSGALPSTPLYYRPTLCHSAAATLFLFRLLTFTPKSDAGYRYSISVTPVDKRNFSHIYTLPAILGSWQTHTSCSPSCQWETPPPVWRAAYQAREKKQQLPSLTPSLSSLSLSNSLYLSLSLRLGLVSFYSQAQNKSPRRTVTSERQTEEVPFYFIDELVRMKSVAVSKCVGGVPTTLQLSMHINWLAIWMVKEGELNKITVFSVGLSALLLKIRVQKSLFILCFRFDINGLNSTVMSDLNNWVT